MSGGRIEPLGPGSKVGRFLVRAGLSATAAIAGLIVCSEHYFGHKCNLGWKWLEEGSPQIMAAVCGLLVLVIKRYRISITVVALVLILYRLLVPTIIAPWYLRLIHRVLP